MDDGLTNIWLVFRFLSKFWLSWKSSFGEDTLFLKGFYFCINFTNFLKNICADQVVLKIRALNQEKNSWSALVKISDQEFKSWSTKYLKLKIKNKSWYIHDIFEPLSNNASLTFPFNATVVGYFDILEFCLITVIAFLKDISQFKFPSCTHAFFSSYFFLCRSQKVISLTKSLLKIN